MFKKAMTTEQRLERNIFQLMQSERYQCMAQIIMIGDKEVDENHPTACTNGRDEKYGRKFMDKCDDAEQRGVIIHENKHKMYQHLKIYAFLWQINPRLANMAMDYVINLEILDENPDGWCKLPDCALVDEKFRGMDTYQVFQYLQQNPPTNPKPEGEDGDEEGGEGGEGGGGGGTESNPPGNTSGDTTDTDTPNGDGGMDEHDWTGAKDLTEQEKEELEEEIDAAIQDGLKLAGKTGSGGNRALEELAKPRVDWRKVLRQFITDTVTGNDYTSYRRPNRRHYGEGYYLPSGMSDKIGELVDAPDMSGSIGAHEISVMHGEMKSICDTVKPSKLHVMYWDTEVCRHEEYEENEIDKLIESTKPEGGGGTDASCIPEYMKDNNINPQAAVIMTDGYVYNWGNWSCPVLWLIIDNEGANPPFGKFIHVKSRDMR